jgi:hypothetical protein
MAVENVTFDPKTPLPFNVPAMQTVLVRIAGRIAFSTVDDFEGTPTAMSNYLDRNLAARREIGVELKGLGDYIATTEVTVG